MIPDAPGATAALLGGLYAIDATHPVSDVGGVSAFAARRNDKDAQYIAIEVHPGTSPRSHVLEALCGAPVPGVLNPLAHGRARPSGRKLGYYVICPAPPGSSLAAPRRWTEDELLNDVMRPAIAALASLAARGLTHRGLRPANLFQAQPGKPVLLGPAWSAPPASLQPAIYEAPYVALCHPVGRGEGAVADDLYALGATLVVLALGREPMEGLDTANIVRRKVALGSFAALTEGARLPPTLAEYVRCMLADDPSLRPSPSDLLDRKRTVLGRSVKWERRATDPVILGNTEITRARELAFTMALAPDEAARSLRLGIIERWVRRNLGEPALARQMERVVQDGALDGPAGRADASMLVRAVALLDRDAPITWRGLSFFPDGLRALLGAADLKSTLAELIDAEAIGMWAAMHAGDDAAARARIDARRYRLLLRRPGWSGGLIRLLYELNPHLPCRSPLVSEWAPRDLTELVEALEARVTGSNDQTATLLDMDVAGFALARGATELEVELSRFPDRAPGPEKTLALFRVLAALQARVRSRPLPALSQWLVRHAEPVLATWREKKARVELADRLSQLAEQGDISALIVLIQDPARRARDAAGFRRAEATLARIDAELQCLTRGTERRIRDAERLGQELAAGVGLVAVAGTLMVLAFG